MSNELVAGLGGAVLGAVVAGVFAWLLHRSEQLVADKAELRRTVSKLIDYQEELGGRIMEISDSRAREAATRSIGTKRMIEMETAAALAKRIGDEITTAEYLTLAGEWYRDTDFKTAEKYYLLGVSAARTTVAKVFALRSLAIFYFSPGPLQNFDKGRAQFGKAVQVLSEPTDEYSNTITVIPLKLGHPKRSQVVLQWRQRTSLIRRVDTTKVLHSRIP